MRLLPQISNSGKFEQNLSLSPSPAPSLQTTQVLSRRIDRIDAEKVYSDIYTKSISVRIIDTGIDILHPDLKESIRERNKYNK